LSDIGPKIVRYEFVENKSGHRTSICGYPCSFIRAWPGLS